MSGKKEQRKLAKKRKAVALEAIMNENEKDRMKKKRVKEALLEESEDSNEEAEIKREVCELIVIYALLFTFNVF
jgi:hypothetical protein